MRRVAIVGAGMTPFGEHFAEAEVTNARVASAHSIGGPTAVSAVTILEGPAGNGG